MTSNTFITANSRYEQHKSDFIHENIPSVISETYEEYFRFVDIPQQVYVCKRNGFKGLVDEHGKEIIPCEQEEIYEMIDTDGVIPFCKNGKWGLCHLGVCTPTIFEDIEIDSEEYCRVCLDGKWGWIDSEGNFTDKESNAWFGSWCDCDK